MENNDYQEMQNKYIAPTYGTRNLVIEKGEGVYLYDINGKKYLDCFSNYGVNILGHGNKRISDVLASQSSRLMNMHGSFGNSQRSLYAKKLINMSHLDKIFFCNSGTEAVEAAIKFSRLATKKTEIIAAKMGYHGKTMGSLSLTRTLPKYNEPFMPLLDNVQHFSFNDVDSLKEIISEKTAAVILEPIQGESGIRIPDNDFFIKVRKICDEHNTLLIIDEIQSGMGRTGKLFAIDHFNVKADMICLAKGIASGIPMGALLISDKISESLFSGCHTNTFGGNPLVCSAGLETLQIIDDDNLLENASLVGKYFTDELKKINSDVIREVRGLGLMIAIELKTKCTKYVREMQENGLLVIPTGATIIRILPPLIFSRENVDEAVSIIKKVLE